MFPTPPSLSETNPTHSPGTDLGMDIVEAICTKVEPFTGTSIDTASKVSHISLRTYSPASSVELMAWRWH